MRNTIGKALNEYNKYRVPEIIAKLESIDEVSFHIKFSGSFCETCGYYDYFDDFMILLEDDFGLKTEIKEIIETIDGAVVKFQMLNDLEVD
jgi:superoxide reductase